MTGGDATSFADTAAAVDATVEAFGGLDVLATFVGVFDYYVGLGELTDEQLDAGFDEAFRVTVKAAHLGEGRAPPPDRRAGRGRPDRVELVVGPGRGGVLYVGTKFAVRGLVVALAHELAPAVRVNAVAPGGTLGTISGGSPRFEQAGRSLGDVHGGRGGPADPRRAPGRAHRRGSAAATSSSLRRTPRGMTGQLLRPDGGASIG